jgi:very-short-patch-repair endonuclease
MNYLNQQLWPTAISENKAITIMGDSTGKPYFVLAIDRLSDLNFVSPASGGTQQFPRYRYTAEGERIDNITDWGLKQFRAHYAKAGTSPSPLAGEGGASAPDEGFSAEAANLSGEAAFASESPSSGPSGHLLPRGEKGNAPDRYTSDGERIDNTTDWGLKQFRAHYAKAGAFPSPHSPSIDGRSIERPMAGEGGASAPDEGFSAEELAPSSGPSGHLLPQGEKEVARRAKILDFAKSMRQQATEAEAALWHILRARRFSGFKFRRQAPIGGYIADFVCFAEKLIVEADGSQHAESARDEKRDAWFAEQGFRVRRFWNAEIIQQREMVGDTLWHDLAGASSPSPLAGEGGASAPDEGFGGEGVNPSSGPSRHLLPQEEKEKARPITKDAIFHYVYGVLHDPVYREKYAINLKRDFPRLPFYPDFWQWAEWGERLMALHIGYESVEPWPIFRADEPDEKARAAGVSPKPILKSDRDSGTIRIDSETTLSGIPPKAFDYRLGNRSGLDWILDQHKEKTPKDPTIREKFNTYRFKDYKEKVIDLIARVTRVSVETMEIVESMKKAVR